MKNLLLLCFFFSVFVNAAAATDQEKITVVTENLAPFNYINNGQVNGICTVKVKQVMESLGFADTKIRVLPWARAYNMAIHDENVLIYSMLRTAEREEFFQWVAKLADIRVVVFRLKNRTDIKIENLEDMRNYSMAAFVDSAAHHYFQVKKFKDISVVGVYESMIHLLVNGRVDIIPAMETGFMATAEKFGFVDQIELIYNIKDLEKPLYAAFGNKTSPELVKKFQNAFKELD